MTTAELLLRYEAMQLASQRMLDAARKGDWERLVALEQSRSGIERLLAENDRAAWNGPHAARKADILRAILDANEETRALAVHRMDEMRRGLENINTGKKMKQAYEGP